MREDLSHASGVDLVVPGAVECEVGLARADVDEGAARANERLDHARGSALAYRVTVAFSPGRLEDASTPGTVISVPFARGPQARGRIVALDFGGQRSSSGEERRHEQDGCTAHAFPPGIRNGSTAPHRTQADPEGGVRTWSGGWTAEPRKVGWECGEGRKFLLWV